MYQTPTKGRRLTQPPLQHVLPKIIAAVDVKNPLLGTNGATRVFGPQKGASKSELDNLERALSRLADVVATEFGFDYRNEAGAGAAGGLGFALLSLCGATIRPGFEVVAEAVGLEPKMKNADLVITGEGRLDRQTLEGKTPAGVARLAQSSESLCSQLLAVHLTIKNFAKFLTAFTKTRARE